MGTKLTAKQELKIYRRAGELLLSMRRYTKYGSLRVDASVEFGFHFTWSLLADQDWWDLECIVDYAFLRSDASVDQLAQQIMARWRSEIDPAQEDALLEAPA